MQARLLAPLAVTLCLALVGCSSSPAPPPASAPEARPSARPEQRSKASTGRQGSTGVEAKRSRGRGDRRAGQRDRQTGLPKASADSRAGRDRPRAPTLASGFASRPDPAGDGDREGETPGYADLRRATVQGRGAAARFTVTVDGPIPAAGTGDGTYMTASFRLRMQRGREHQIYVTGDKHGWKPDLDNRGHFPGRFSIAGDRFIFELPWSELGGPSRFTWLTRSSWTRSSSGPLDQIDFAFDQVPEYEDASYPE